MRTKPVAGLKATPRGEDITLCSGLRVVSLQQPPVPAKVPMAPDAMVMVRTREPEVSTMSSCPGRCRDSCAVLENLAAAPVPSA